MQGKPEPKRSKKLGKWLEVNYFKNKCELGPGKEPSNWGEQGPPCNSDIIPYPHLGGKKKQQKHAIMWRCVLNSDEGGVHWAPT